jgi:TRL (tRNA-associated locus)-like protein
MRMIGLLLAMSLVVGIEGCMIVEAPIRGVVGTEVTWGDTAMEEASSSAPGQEKQGKACAESILGLMAHGNAGVRAAKLNGGITKVTNIEHSARNFFGIVGEWCTIVRGH